MGDVCEQRQEGRRQNRKQLCKNSCQSERMDWQGSVCAHTHSVGLHGVTAQQCFLQTNHSGGGLICVSQAVPSTASKPRFFPQVFPLERPRAAVSIRSCFRIARQQHQTQSLMREMPPHHNPGLPPAENKGWIWNWIPAC